MQRTVRMSLLLTLALSACSVIPASPETVPSVTAEAAPPLTTSDVPDPKLISTVGTPHIEQPPDPERRFTPAPPEPQDCGYQWAYQDLPELSSAFQRSLQTLQPDAQGTAFAFGENCILANGSVGAFLPMETDFNMMLQVSDLKNESDLGEWVVKVMQVISVLPPEWIAGPRPGRVTLVFQSAGEEKTISFYINQYQELPAGLSRAEIFRRLQIPQ